MAKSNETPSTPPGDDRNLIGSTEAVASPELEEVVQQFWEKNRSLLMALAIVVLVAIVGRNGWAYLKASQIESARTEFAAADSDAALKEFADDHAGTALAGAALLKLADTAYAEQRFGDAIAAYESAAEELAATIFADRIALGRAMAIKENGDLAGGLAALQDLANDTDAASAVRGEAVYHLAAMALDSGDLAEIDALAVQVDSFAPGSTWAQRVTLMRAAAESELSSSVEETMEDTSEISVDLP